MVTMQDLEQQFRVKPGKRLRLKEHDPGWSGDKEMRDLKGDALKERAKAFIQENLSRLGAAQYSASRSLPTKSWITTFCGATRGACRNAAG